MSSDPTAVIGTVQGGAAGPRITLPMSVGGGALVFVSSAAVLVLEIVAMRLVAPYVGVTLQTSSAVIGTALAAMALGAWLGGRLADRSRPARLLGPLIVLGGVLTMLTVPIVRQVGTWLQGTDAGAVPTVLLLALLAVFPPSAALSTVTPMVVKLQLADLGRTGAVVGRLSGIGTLGAITATFLTGFVLLASFRTSAILLGMGGILVAAGGGLVLRHRRLRALMLSAAALPLVPWLFLASPSPCQVETDYHCARVEESPAGSSGRELLLDTLNHGHIDLADPRVLLYEYIRTMAATVNAVRPSDAPIAGLYIGGGGFTLPRYQAATRPGSTATVMEIDTGVVEISRAYLGAQDVPGMTTRVGDARTGVRRERPGSYDVVFGDAFGGLAVPWHLTTVEAARDIRRVMRSDGIYLINVIDRPPNSFARAEVATLRTVFPHVAIATTSATLTTEGGTGINHVIIASGAPLSVPAIADRVQTSNPDWRVLDQTETAAFAEDAAPLRDDLAPVDQLLTTTVDT